MLVSLTEIAIRASALIIGIALTASPLLVGYLIYRPYDRKIRELFDKAETAPTIEEHSRWIAAKWQYEHGLEARRGCWFALLGFALTAMWLAFVASHWRQIARLLFS